MKASVSTCRLCPSLLGGTLAVLLGILTGLSLADEPGPEVRALITEGKLLPLEQVLKSVNKEKAWHLIEAELEREGDNWIYELEMLDEMGQVHELEVDAASGQLLESKIEDD